MATLGAQCSVGVVRRQAHPRICKPVRCSRPISTSARRTAAHTLYQQCSLVCLRRAANVCALQTTHGLPSQVRVIRNGQEVGISTYDLLVGDVLLVATGDILAADGLLFQGNELRCLPIAMLDPPAGA